MLIVQKYGVVTTLAIIASIMFAIPCEAKPMRPVSLAEALGSDYIAELEACTASTSRYGKQPHEFTINYVQCKVLHVFKSSAIELPAVINLHYEFSDGSDCAPWKSWQRRWKDRKPENGFKKSIKGLHFIAFINGSPQVGYGTYRGDKGRIDSSPLIKSNLIKALNNGYSTDQLIRMKPNELGSSNP
jgi:hypothetical protein